MNVNQKGHLGLVRVVYDLTKQGYEVFLPQHDYSAVDVIVMNTDGVVRRLQVKYRENRTGRNGKAGTIEVPLYSMVNLKRIPINRSLIDGWAIYVAEVDTVIYIPVDVADENANSFNVRIHPRAIESSRSPVAGYTAFLDAASLWKVSEQTRTSPAKRPLLTTVESAILSPSANNTTM